MAAKQKTYDPLAWVPTPETARRLFADAQAKADRLKILVEVSERLYATGPDRPARVEKAFGDSGDTR